MKTVLATSLVAFILLGMPVTGFATETGTADTQTSVVPEGEPTPPEAADDETDGDEPAGDQSDSDADIMQNYTRHRPGACPEGPPCKVED